MELSRRKFLAAAASAAGGATFASMLGNLRPLTAAETTQLTSAQDPSIKKWIWVIDLEKCNGCMKCTEPPAATVSTRMSASASSVCGEAVKGLMAKSGTARLLKVNPKMSAPM